jgi:hypothetical protein
MGYAGSMEGRRISMFKLIAMFLEALDMGPFLVLRLARVGKETVPRKKKRKVELGRAATIGKSFLSNWLVSITCVA